MEPSRFPYYKVLVLRGSCSYHLDMALERLLDRDTELSELNHRWRAAAAGSPQLVVVWGRRRVGKTFLLSHLVAGKRSVFFGATEQAEGIELGRLAEAVRRDLGAPVADLVGGRFAGWEAALRFFVALAKDDPLVVVLDEVPYLIRSTPGFASIVQAVWDHVPPGTKLMLVLTGSAVGTIEGLLSGGGALRGRPTRALRLDPLGPVEATTFLARLEPAAYLEAYAACGGYPLHLKRWDPSGSTVENLLELAATPGGILLEDASGILREELPDVGGYPRVLAAIGRGRTRMSEIAADADQRVEHPIEVLLRSGFVRRTQPVGAPRKARPVYELGDPYLAFWFGVLYMDLPHIEAGQGRAVLKRRTEQWQRHVGWVFEEAARAHAVRLVTRGELPSDLVVGRWWATSGEACEVDVLGLRGSKSALLGEARWQAGPLGTRDLRELIAKLPRVPRPVEDPIFALWGRGGVEADVRRAGALGFDLRDVLRT
jgi:AAA+ ATPase superfamily predicted ATPase